MNPEILAQAIAVVLTASISLVTFFSRVRRLRNDIRENLALIQELDKDEVLHGQSLAATWLRKKVEIDAAKLSGQPLGKREKPVDKPTVVIGSILCAGLSYLTYYLNRTTFNWFSIITGMFAFFSLMMIYGSFPDREIPSSLEDDELQENSDSAEAGDDGKVEQ
jgi:hypothetical protein